MALVILLKRELRAIDTKDHFEAAATAARTINND
jgi:hypothetical protein